MTLNWKYQIRAATDVLQDKGKMVNSSMLAPQQKLTFIQNCIRPAITYALPICPYTTKDVQALDNKMAAIAKKAMGLSKSMSNGMVLLDKDEAGMGVTSLFVDYGQLVSAHLTKCLNDDGPLGRSTRALLAWQHRTCKGHRALILESNGHSRALDTGMGTFSLMRQLSLIDSLGINVHGPSTCGALASSSLYDSLTQYHKSAHPDIKKLPKCVAKIYQFLRLGIGNMTELMERNDGILCMITATTLRSRFPQAESGHVHLLHQTAAYLCRGKDMATKRLRDLPQSLRQVSNIALWDNDSIRETTDSPPEVKHTLQNQPRAVKMMDGLYKLALNQAKAKSRKRKAEPQHQPKTVTKKAKPAKKPLPQAECRRSSRLRNSCAPEATQATPPIWHQQVRQKLEDSKLDSVNDYKQWCLGVSCKQEHIIAAYDEADRVTEIVADSTDQTGSLCYEVRWSNSYMPERHLDLYKVMGYKPTEVRVCLNISPAFPWDQRLLEVKWGTSIEPATTIEDQPESASLIAEYMTKKKGRFACNATRTDTALTEQQRQGHESKLHSPDMPWPAAHAAKISIDTMHSAHPDFDRMPTGKFAVQSQGDMAHMLRPDGTFAGKISKARLTLLYQSYLSNSTTGNTGKVAAFVEALCALLVRYQDGFKESDTNGTKLSNHWATPDPYMKAIQRGLNLKTERFASPLNHSEHLEAYFSRFKEDAVFGANVDAFSVKWTGPSQCNPEYEADAMEMAVKWAIASATDSEEPSLTAFVLPHWPKHAYHQHMNNPMVHTLLRVPQKQFKFKKPDFWRADGGVYASHPKWDVNIFIVSNVAGLQYINAELLKSELQEASMAVGGIELTPVLPEARGPHAPYCPFLRPFRRLGDQQPEVKPWTSPPHKTPFTRYSRLQPKWKNADTIWYTDGSAKKIDKDGTIIGSGAFCNRGNIRLKIAPCGMGPTNTIMRAELIAIYAVLHHPSTVSTRCTIATDSKAAMHAIHKQIHNPRGNQYNTHKELLKAIALALLRRAQNGLCTEIIKVKSHIGIEGNEVADKLANAAREPDACDVSYDVGHLAHQGEHWPVLIAHPQRDQARHGDRMAGNLQASLKRHIACEHARGLTNHGIYLDLWSKIRADVHKTSHAYWTAPHKVIKIKSARASVDYTAKS